MIPASVVKPKYQRPGDGRFIDAYMCHMGVGGFHRWAPSSRTTAALFPPFALLFFSHRGRHRLHSCARWNRAIAVVPSSFVRGPPTLSSSRSRAKRPAGCFRRRTHDRS